jgi:exosortase
MQPTARTGIMNYLRQHLVLMILIAVHLPFLVAYLRGLWQQTHYQFFPFAIGAFIWLFATRRSGDAERWTWPTWLLIAFDLCCLMVQPWIYSPWLAVVGLVACLTAWCFANRDAGFDRRLTYLALLPLIVVRLPMMYDIQVINWLQRMTTALASKSLHRLGMLHFRDGNVLKFPGKSFLVEEACSGVQSLFTILFIAALVICLKRRSLIHGLVLLASGLAFAGLMNSMRVITIAVAWERYGTDLSTGLPHDIVGYICLAIAAVLLMSADAFLGFVTDPVPDIERPGVVGMYRNPLTALWNRLVAVIPLDDQVMASKTAGATQQRQPSSSQSYTEERCFPTILESLSPWNAFHFLLGWGESWIFSRGYRQLLAGLPFAFLSIGGILLVGWLQNAGDDPLIAQYEAAYNEAVSAKDVARQETYLRALSSLRSTNPAYQFRIAQFMLSEGRFNEGLGEILKLTPDSRLGYSEARLWLVQQALSPNPLKPMTLDEIEEQLKKVLEQVPNHLEAHQLLAQVYLQRKEWRLAEAHLTEVAALKPEENLALARLKKFLQRNDPEFQVTTGRAITALTADLESDRKDPRKRLALADALMLAERETQAREVLVSGLEQHDDPSLRRALSDLDLIQVSRKLNENLLNRDIAVGVAVSALERDPSNLAGIDLLSRLYIMGGEISPESIRPSLDYWQQTVDATPDDAESRSRLGNLLIAAGLDSRAAEVIQPVAAERPELRMMYARLLKNSDRVDEATALLESILSESQAKLENSAGDMVAAAEKAEALLALGRAEQVRTDLATFVDTASDARVPSDPGLAALYGRASIDIYNKLTGYHDDPRRISSSAEQLAISSVDAETLLNLLADALVSPATTMQAINRTARLSLSAHPAADQAEEMVRNLRLDGHQGPQVLNLLGMHAIEMRRFDKAQAYLAQANNQTRSQDPMIVNNLAIAIIRGGGDSKERALDLANTTLTLLPDHPDALSTRGEVYVAMEQWDKAIVDLTQALKLRGNSVVVHRLLEKAYNGQSDFPMAAKHGERAVELELTPATH